MTEDTKADAGASDKAKLAASILLVLAGVACYYVFVAQPTWQRWLAVVAGLLLGIVVFIWSQYGRNFWKFWADSRVELRKVIWPTRRETGITTAVVFGFVIVAAIFFWLLDMGLAYATRHLSGQGS
jgi:preprotein translocase subunit SecE